MRKVEDVDYEEILDKKSEVIKSIKQFAKESDDIIFMAVIGVKDGNFTLLASEKDHIIDLSVLHASGLLTQDEEMMLKILRNQAVARTFPVAKKEKEDGEGKLPDSNSQPENGEDSVEQRDRTPSQETE